MLDGVDFDLFPHLERWLDTEGQLPAAIKAYEQAKPYNKNAEQLPSPRAKALRFFGTSRAAPGRRSGVIFPKIDYLSPPPAYSYIQQCVELRDGKQRSLRRERCRSSASCSIEAKVSRKGCCERSRDGASPMLDALCIDRTDDFGYRYSRGLTAS